MNLVPRPFIRVRGRPLFRFGLFCCEFARRDFGCSLLAQTGSSSSWLVEIPVMVMLLMVVVVVKVVSS